MHNPLSRARPVRAALSATFASLVAATLVALPAAPAAADPEVTREPGNGAERNEHAAGVEEPAEPLAEEQLQALAAPNPLDTSAPYPRQTTLPEPAEDPDDRSIRLGLVPYHDIAPRLNELQQVSDRVSAEIVGESVEGRDLYLVTVTEPESRGEVRRQELIREQISTQPHRAANNPNLPDRYKTPVFVNNNIHGDEWEGTDASLRLIEELATSDDPETAELLGSTRLYFNVTANPDGRVSGTRANAAGFDLNRDFVTAAQPETVVMRQIMIDKQPLVMLDQHGYVNGTLIEPATPPHGQNYEYDIYIKNTYANALNMEDAVNDLGYTPADDGVLPPQIPFRDWEDGWDDWPPIFTPMYAPYQGTVASATIEFPMRVNRADYTNLPVEELRRRSAINTDISAATIEATFDFVQENRGELITDQIELFRRGAAGEEQVVPPEGWVPGFGPEDVWTTEFPRAYVIPASDGQRSPTAAARLVDHLLANDVVVHRAAADFELDGTTYPAGSYLVDMHQPKRGMANVMLEAGRDISDDIDAMYDISGWSHGLVWGATVTPVADGDPGAVPAKPVAVAGPSGAVLGDGDWELRLDDGKDAAALNDLLEAGVEAVWAGDGTVVVPADAADLVATLADRHGVIFHPAEAEGTLPLDQPTVAAAAGADELFTLREMGFDPVPVSTAVLNGGFDWDGVDVLYVSSGLNYGQLQPAARAALDEFLTRGGVVTRGSTGATFNAAAGLLDATARAGRSDANGIVRVTEDEGGALAARADHAFVYSPLWFTDLGSEVAVELSYATDGPLVAGHWAATSNGSGGQDAAAGQPVVVSGVSDRGAAVVLFGTEPMFRNHPKGMFGQVAQAVHWSAVAAEAPVPAP